MLFKLGFLDLSIKFIKETKRFITEMYLYV